MALTIKDAARRADSLEKELTRLCDANASGADIFNVLSEYRAACENIIFSDFAYASAHGVENQLWNAHLKVNTLFRKDLRHLRRNGKDHVVELRKLAKAYLQFIKSSQRFYRHYILALDTQFDGIPELRKIAQKWKDDATQIVTRKPFPPSLKHQILLSCHQTLIQLGDLSRYRETELADADKGRNWGPAIGFYSLAAEIYPDSGQSHNQQAVIAREDGNHFRSTYHLYRSLATKEPHPSAKSNLELGFKKIISAWQKGELINNVSSRDGATAGRALIAWFIRLHSKCYKGQEFAQHDELENEVLSQLAVELKERSLDGTLQKIILTNLAAEYFATVQMQESQPPPNIEQTYFYYLRLNVKTFFTLLQLLQPELARQTEDSEVAEKVGERSSQLSEKVTAVARRILPGLRLYSMWFTRFWTILNANIASTLTEVEVQELWKAYAETLSLLASTFPVTDLPNDNYMLEEDVETIGFQPLISDETRKNWYLVDGALKPKWSDLERNHPNVEMLMRIRDMLVDGLQLTQNADAPLDLDGLRFIYREVGLPSELLASPNNRPDGSPPVVTEHMDFPLFPAEQPVPEDQASQSVAQSDSGSTTLAKDAAMNRMVDDIVGVDDVLDPLPEEDENIPPTPPEQTFEDTALVNDTSYGLGPLTVNDFVNAMQNYSRPKTSPQTPVCAAMERVASSSSIKQTPNLPSLPGQQYNDHGIWNKNYGSPGPSSPHLGNGGGTRSPSSALRVSGHQRNTSSSSFRSSSGAEWTAGYTLTPVQQATFAGGIGNGASWGNPVHSMYGNATDRTAESSLMSPFFHGQKSSWSTNLDRGTVSSYGRTPPNGQGG